MFDPYRFHAWQGNARRWVLYLDLLAIRIQLVSGSS